MFLFVIIFFQSTQYLSYLQNILQFKKCLRKLKNNENPSTVKLNIFK